MTGSTTPLLSATSSDKQRMLGALMAAFRSHELTSDQMLPAIIESFDRTNNTAVIQPLIQWVDVDNGLHNRHNFAEINVLSLGGGGFNISFPLKKGDLGWIIASDRDISLFKQSLAMAAPNTGRLHSFEDGWFVPDVFRQYTIDGADSDSMVIQSVDSLTRISIKNGVVDIHAPTSVTITTPETTFTGNVTINQNLTVIEDSTIKQTLTVFQASTLQSTLTVTGVTALNAAATVAGSLAVAGATAVNGGLTAATGMTCSLPSNATIGGTTVSGHGHISTTPGSRTSGGMIA